MKKPSKKRALQSRKGSDVQKSLRKIPDQVLVEEIQRRAHGQQSDRTEMSVSSQSFSGPLPPPQILEEYKSAGANIPDRIVKMAEKEQAHRHQLEEEASNVPLKRTGQICALIIILAFLGCAVFLISRGLWPFGIFFLSGPLLWLVHLFITGRKKDD